eukprot:SAG22_NODE_752_length_7449_cov_8.296463_4_plen_128_part_00
MRFRCQDDPNLKGGIDITLVLGMLAAAVAAWFDAFMYTFAEHALTVEAVDAYGVRCKALPFLCVSARIVSKTAPPFLSVPFRSFPCRLTVCLSVCLSICLPACLPACLPCLPVLRRSGTHRSPTSCG